MTLSFTESQIEYLQTFFDFQWKRKYRLLDIFNAVFYIADSGCKYRSLPEIWPPFQVVHYCFQTWTDKGILDQIQSGLMQRKR